MSRNPKSFVIWTDASETTDHLTTITGYVIKDCYREWPPLVGSSVYNTSNPLVVELRKESNPRMFQHKKYYNLHNSKGEMAAALESLGTLADYCETALELNPMECDVAIKTDFQFLKDVLEDGVLVKRRYKNDRESRILLGALLQQRNMFGDVQCDKIDSDKNLAHNICAFRRMEHCGVENRGITRKRYGIMLADKFYNLYENPQKLKEDELS